MTGLYAPGEIDTRLAYDPILGEHSLDELLGRPVLEPWADLLDSVPREFVPPGVLPAEADEPALDKVTTESHWRTWTSPKNIPGPEPLLPAADPHSPPDVAGPGTPDGEPPLTVGDWAPSSDEEAGTES